MNKSMLTAFAMGLTLLATSCAGLDKAMTGSNAVPTSLEREKTVSQYPDLTNDQKNKFISGEPWIGMTQDQLKVMWNNDPKKTQKKLTANGNVEIQLYEVRIGDWKTGIKSKFYKVTLLEHKVTELQELDNEVGTFDKI